jgi:acyl carrier protein
MINGWPTDSKVRQDLRAFVEDAFLYLKPDLQLADDDRLLELGVVDSLGFVELVEEVQDRFGVEVSDVEITEENFGSISAMAAFVDRKARAAA